MTLSFLSRAALRQSRRCSSSTAVAVRSMSLTASPWTDFEMAPLDPIIGLNEQYQKDDFPSKVIVGVGAYRDDSGKPFVLPCVREAEDILRSKNMDMEYAGIVSPSFCPVYEYRTIPHLPLEPAKILTVDSLFAPLVLSYFL